MLMRRCFVLLRLWLACIIWLPVHALAAVNVGLDQNSIDLSASVQVVRNAPENLNINDIQETIWQSRFDPHPPNGKAINLGLASDVVWLRIEIDVSEQAPCDLILDVPYGRFHQIQWFVPRADRTSYMPATDLNPKLVN